MATKTLSIAGVSDFNYDDALFPAAIHTTGILRSDATPVGGSDVLRKDDVGSGGTIAPADAQYVVVALDGIEL
ncbi:hypothetical protein IIB79_04375 [candidate division KSB1 bacterium]|nr:hypothetical protein [candidate division KSB1 bacterium]